MGRRERVGKVSHGGRVLRKRNGRDSTARKGRRYTCRTKTPSILRALLYPLACALLAAPASATTYFVAADGADATTRDGLTAATAWASLAYACDRVPAGEHVIRLGAGVFLAEATATVKSGITIEGAGATLTRKPVTIRGGAICSTTETFERSDVDLM